VLKGITKGSGGRIGCHIPCGVKFVVSEGKFMGIMMLLTLFSESLI
jgi:hypothetical protein